MGLSSLHLGWGPRLPGAMSSVSCEGHEGAAERHEAGSRVQSALAGVERVSFSWTRGADWWVTEVGSVGAVRHTSPGGVTHSTATTANSAVLCMSDAAERQRTLKALITRKVLSSLSVTMSVNWTPCGGRLTVCAVSRHSVVLLKQVEDNVTCPLALSEKRERALGCGHVTSRALCPSELCPKAGGSP